MFRSKCRFLNGLLLCFVAVAISVFPLFAQNQTSGPTDPAELEAFMDGLVETLLDDHDIAGATVSVVKDGALFFAKGYGYADLKTKKSVEADKTLFRIGSISKLFVWTSIMQLLEQGKLDLDADINTYLVDFKIPDTYEAPVTLKHLMTHTAGFEEYVLGLFAQSTDKLRPLGEILADELPARVRPPGKIASYSNHGTGMAAYIVEQVSGMMWDDYVEQNILQPLGMEHATFRQPPPDHLAQDMSKGYTFSDGEFHEQDFEYVPLAPVGAASVAATDMAKFMIAHLQLGQFGEAKILETATAKLMQSPLHRHAEAVNPMSHGFIDMSMNGQWVIGHGGDTFWFHSMLAFLPEQNVGIFVSYNSPGGGAASKTYRTFMDRYYPADESETLTIAENAKDRLQRFTGSYRANRYAHRRLTKLAAAFSTIKVTSTDDGKLRTNVPEVKKWIETAPLTFQEEDGQQKIVFREDAKGNITYMFLSNLPIIGFERVGSFETPVFQLSLAIGANVLFLATVIFWPLAAYIRRRHGFVLDVKKKIPSLAKIIAWSASLLLIVFTLGLAGVLSNPNDIVYGIPASLKVLLVLPLIASVLILGTLACTGVIWKERQGGLFGRLYYTILTLAFIAFVLQLNYWNLYGFHY